MAVSLPRPRREPFLVHEDTLALPSTHAVQPAAHYSMVDLVADLRETRLSTEATRLIHRAAAEGDVEQLHMLINQGADVNLKEPSDGSSTPLHKAAHSGHLLATSLLLHHGALPTLRDARNQTPLQVAKQRRQGDWQRIIEVLEESPVATKATPVAAAGLPSAASTIPDVVQQVKSAPADVKLLILRMLLADASVVPSALSIAAARLESKLVLGASSDPAPLLQMPLCCAAPRKTPSGLHRGDFARVERPT